MIEPALTADVADLAIQGQGAAEGQARVGVVEGGVARALLAVTLFALQHRRLGGTHLQIKIPRLALHLEGGGKKRFPLRGQCPLFEPILTATGTGQSRPLAAGALVLLVAAFAHIRDGELGQPELGSEPGVVGCYLLLDALTKQGPLHAVAAPLLVFQVAGEIPPLGAVVGVGTVIRGQADGLTRQSLFEVIVAAAKDGAQVVGTDPGAIQGADQRQRPDDCFHTTLLAAYQEASAPQTGASRSAVTACKGAASKASRQPKARGLTTSISTQARP